MPRRNAHQMTLPAKVPTGILGGLVGGTLSYALRTAGAFRPDLNLVIMMLAFVGALILPMSTGH